MAYGTFLFPHIFHSFIGRGSNRAQIHNNSLMQNHKRLYKNKIAPSKNGAILFTEQFVMRTKSHQFYDIGCLVNPYQQEIIFDMAL